MDFHSFMGLDNTTYLNPKQVISTLERTDKPGLQERANRGSLLIQVFERKRLERWVEAIAASIVMAGMDWTGLC